MISQNKFYFNFPNLLTWATNKYDSINLLFCYLIIKPFTALPINLELLDSWSIRFIYKKCLMCRLMCWKNNRD